MTAHRIGSRDAAASGSAQELDSALLMLCEEFHENRREIDSIWDGEQPPIDGSPSGVRSGVLVNRYHELCEQIAALPAKTIGGAIAKAGVIVEEFRGEDDLENEPDQYDPRSALAVSLARDVLGRAA